MMLFALRNGTRHDGLVAAISRLCSDTDHIVSFKALSSVHVLIQSATEYAEHLVQAFVRGMEQFYPAASRRQHKIFSSVAEAIGG